MMCISCLVNESVKIDIVGGEGITETFDAGVAVKLCYCFAKLRLRRRHRGRKYEMFIGSHVTC